jgi:Uma2 family endonuclease
MSLQPKSPYTPEEYLALERKAEYRSEYFAGEIFVMSGASERHNLIVGNVFATLHTQLRNRPCRVYASDMRVKVNPTGLYTYPDIVALCGEPQFDDEQKDILLNPAVIIEVLSPSTEAYDRGEKFAHYRQLSSVAEYVLISQEKPHVEHFVRQPDNQWLLSETSDLHDAVQLPSINCALALDEVYEKVEIGAYTRS